MRGRLQKRWRRGRQSIRAGVLSHGKVEREFFPVWSEPSAANLPTYTYIISCNIKWGHCYYLRVFQWETRLSGGITSLEWGSHHRPVWLQNSCLSLMPHICLCRYGVPLQMAVPSAVGLEVPVAYSIKARAWILPSQIRRFNFLFTEPLAASSACGV